ncbi:hypothetical protein [Caldanaerobius polysaccharolyticus]|uniref:hypothetical protein n=1 Tax=Caldanaerobius polysaccharolyticus TaxID=44256 RepID=UPI00047EB40F|nr:hypothetical protein [Caldanaerobius polysaccharolyticus]
MDKVTIMDFEGSWLSGLATLVVKDEKGNVKRIPCENGPTVRALAEMFPDVIGPGHTVNMAAIKGKKIRYGMDDFGLVLGWISPAED